MSVENNMYKCGFKWFRNLGMRKSRLLDTFTRSCAVVDKSFNDGLNIACSL